MTKQFTPLDKSAHSHLKIKPAISHAHLLDQNIVPLVAFEFGFVGANFPVMFVKDPSNGDLRAIGICGFEDGENLIFTKDKINSRYIPMDVQRYPFAVARDEENQRMVLCVDTANELINEEEGESLIDAEGNLGKRAEASQQVLKNYVEQEMITREMIRLLDEYELIQPAQVQVTIGEDKRALNGLYRIDDQKLAELEDEKVLELHKRNYFPAIFAHLHSLSQLQHLIDLKAEAKK